MVILSVVGTRPNFMKIAPICAAIERYNKVRADLPRHAIKHVLVHTGQHYDQLMSASFFDDLNLPRPDINLGVGSKSHVEQLAEIMTRFAEVLHNVAPDVVIVAGDVNSTLACALAASKTFYDSESKKPLIVHVEAGLRSFDRAMPEETNRLLTDHLSDLLFVTEKSGILNLRKEGIADEKIHYVGNTMVDTLLAFRERADNSKILAELGIVPAGWGAEELRQAAHGNGVGPYTLLTLHRPSNIDKKPVFMSIIEALTEVSAQMPVVFPAHPRTVRGIRNFGLDEYFNFVRKPVDGEERTPSLERRINLIDPLGYLDFLCLMSHARIVVTDSGGIQEETTCLGVPCVTVRNNTERPITVEEGTNVLAGTERATIVEKFNYQLKSAQGCRRPDYWDGRTAERIIDILAAKVMERKKAGGR